MNHDSKHMWLMVLACAIPLLLVVLLPLLGVKMNITWIAVGLMFVMHLWMMKGHGSHDSHTTSEKVIEGSQTKSKNAKSGGKSHGCH